MTLSNVADFSPFGNIRGNKNPPKNDRNRLESCKFQRPFVTWVAAVPCIGEVWPLLNSTVSSHMQAIPCYNDPIAGVRSCCRVGLLKTEIYFWGFFCCLFFFLVSCCWTGNCVLRLTCCLGLWKHFSVNLEKKFCLWKKTKKTGQ